MSCGFNMFIRHSCLFISQRLGGSLSWDNATFLGLLFGQIFQKFYWFLEKSGHFNIFCSPRVRRAFRQVWTISCQTKICVELTSPQRVKPEFLLLLPDGVDSGFVTGHRGQHRRRPEARSSHERTGETAVVGKRGKEPGEAEECTLEERVGGALLRGSSRNRRCHIVQSFCSPVT